MRAAEMPPWARGARPRGVERLVRAAATLFTCAGAERRF